MADRIKCSHILVKKQSEAIAIIERLRKGESFANLARELSIDKGSGKRGGDLGFFGRGMMVKPFEEAAFKLQKGEMTQEPVKTEFGYHIIKRVDWLNGENKNKLNAHLEEELYDLITYCIQNPNASDLESKKQRAQEIGKELYADGGVDAMENIFYPIEIRIKEEIGKDAKSYRSLWNEISKEEWSY